MKPNVVSEQQLGGRFGYFLLFSALGRGGGSPRRQEGAGVGFLLKIPGGGLGSPTRGGGGTGRVSAGNWGGGLQAGLPGTTVKSGKLTKSA